MQAPLSKYPALPAAVGLIVGLVCQHYGIAWWAFVLSIVVSAALYANKWHYLSFYFLMSAIGVALGYVSAKPQMPAEFLGKSRECVVLLSRVDETDGGLRCFVKFDSIDRQASPHWEGIIYVSGLSPELINIMQPGATVAYSAKLKPLAEGDTTTHGRYNYDNYYRRIGISSKANVSGQTISLVSPPGWIDSSANTTRREMFNAIAYSPINGESAAFLIAAILGDKTYLGSDSYAEFRSTGVAHILALSGLHVGIIMSIVSLFLFPLRMNIACNRIRAVIAIILVWFYALITGMSPSVMRAAVMASILMLGFLIQRRVFTFNSLCLAAVIVLAFQPQSLFTAGFQMSFLAVASILLFMSIVPDSLHRHPVKYYLCVSILVPVAAMIGTGIISAYYFGTFPLLFLLTNIVVGLIFPIMLSVGFILMLLTMAGCNSAILTPLGWIVDACNWAINIVVGSLASLDMEISVSPFTAWAVIPYAIAVLLLAYFLKLRFRKIA